MATVEHNGTSMYAGDIVVYTGSYGATYGYELIKEVWVELVAEHRWIVRGIKIKAGENSFTYLSTEVNLEAMSIEDIQRSYPLKWTKDPEYKKGDILVGKGKTSGKKMLFVYLANDHVERLTARDDMIINDDFGYSSLRDYEDSFGPLEVHRTQGYLGAANHSRFSDL